MIDCGARILWVVLMAWFGVQVWSSDAEQTHSPPSNLVMKEQTWHLADQMKTTLLDPKGEVVILPSF